MAQREQGLAEEHIAPHNGSSESALPPRCYTVDFPLFHHTVLCAHWPVSAGHMPIIDHNACLYTL